MNSTTPPVALTIAGSDSSGGAGIQADLKTFDFHGVHGASAITCVTAQNTMGVSRVDPMPPLGVVAQIRAVREDFVIAATKIGMLLNVATIEGVAAELEASPLDPLVLDPVMVARSGDQLIDDDAIRLLVDLILPIATIVTPNVAEAEILADVSIVDLESMKAAAHAIANRGAAAVLITGGSLPVDDLACDAFVWQDGIEILTTRRVETANTHGTGCTLSAAVAAHLALGSDLPTAVVRAKEYVANALACGLSLGRGAGPIQHNLISAADRNTAGQPRK